MMVMMKCCAPLLIWGIILCYLALLTVFGCLFYFKAKGTYEIDSLDFINNQLNDNENVLLGIKFIILSFFSFFRFFTKNLLGLGVALWVLAAISVLLICCLFNRIRLAIAVMEEASNYIRDVMTSFVVPVIMFVVSIAFLCFWFFVTLYLYSSGDITKRGETPFGHVSWDTKIKRLLAYYIVALIWNVEFLIAFTQLVLAFSAAFWYFAPGNPKQLSAVVRSVKFCCF